MRIWYVTSKKRRNEAAKFKRWPTNLGIVINIVVMLEFSVVDPNVNFIQRQRMCNLSKMAKRMPQEFDHISYYIGSPPKLIDIPIWLVGFSQK